MKYRNVWEEYFNRDTVNCEIGGDNTKNILWRSNNIPLPQPLKYVVINCGANNLDTDNPGEISDGLICIALLFQKRLKQLQIVVNGLIPCDAINTKRRQKLFEVNQLLQDKCTDYTSVYLVKPDADWATLDGGINKTFYYKDNIHLFENGNKKLPLPIKTKLDNIKINLLQDCHKQKCSTNNKTVDYQWAYQPQIRTKTQPETTSHPKHIAQTRDNNNISKSIKRKDAKQGKLHKPPPVNPPQKKLANKCPLTKK